MSFVKADLVSTVSNDLLCLDEDSLATVCENCKRADAEEAGVFVHWAEVGEYKAGKKKRIAFPSLVQNMSYM